LPIANRGIHCGISGLWQCLIQECGVAATPHLRQLNASMTRWTNNPMNAPIGDRQSLNGQGPHSSTASTTAAASP
jgi:hypothetical protein